VRPCLQNNQSKKAGGVAQEIENLPSKCKALSSNASTTKQRKNPSPFESCEIWGAARKSLERWCPLRSQAEKLWDTVGESKRYPEKEMRHSAWEMTPDI
jgi:hypothetical protein